MFGLTDLLAQAPPSGFVVVVDKVARAPLSLVVLFAILFTVIRLAVWPILKNTPRHKRMGNYTFARIVNDVCDAVVYAGVVVFMLVRPFGVQTFFIPSGSMINTLHLYDYIVANKFIYRFKEPNHGDIVVFKPPKEALFPDQGDTDFIKRLIGKPGDVIEWKDKVLYRNGQAVDEPYVDYTFPGDPGGPPMPRQDWGTIRQANFKLVKDGERYIPVQYTDNTVNMMPLGTAMDDEMITGCAKELVPRSPDEARRWKDLPPAPIPPKFFLFMGDNRNGSFDGRGWGLVPRESIIGKSEFIWFPMARWRQTK